MKTFFILITSIVFLLSCAGCSMVSKNSCGWSVSDGTKKVEIVKEDGSGTAIFQEVFKTCTNGATGNKFNALGYKDDTGKVIVEPMQFQSVEFISDRRAIVGLNFEKGIFGLYTFNGESQGLVELNNMYVRELPSQIPVGKNAPRTFAGVALADAKMQTYNVTLFTSYMKQSKTLKNLGGTAVLSNYTDIRTILPKFVRRYSDHIIIDGTDAQTKQSYSQFLTLDGSAVTPQIGYVSQYYYPSNQRELVTQIGRFSDLNFPVGYGLYWPISISGELLPLPTGAVGVFPLMNYSQKITGWMIFYSGQNGLELEPHVGKISEISKNSTRSSRYTGFVYKGVRNNQGTYLVRQKDNSWSIFDEGKVTEYTVPGSPQSLPTMNGMYQAYTTYNTKLSAQYDAERKAREVAYQAAQQKNLLEKKQAAIATLKTQNICNYLDTVITAGEPYIGDYVRKCPISTQSDVDKLMTVNVDRNFLIQKSTEISQAQARQKYSAQMAEVNYQNALKAWSSVGPLSIANPGAPSAQQQRYNMEKQINQQIWKQNWDPYK